jgi:predicted dehydrogenase
MNRRQFIKNSAAATAGTWLLGVHSSFGSVSPNERLNIGVVGTANRAAADLTGVQGENIVAICDVDSIFLDAAQLKFPKAARYTDFRKMLERSDLDAIVIGTPDHTHAVATVAALQSGRHVYCEKPLTHTISETRIVAQTACQTGLVTQLGNQIHATAHYRRVVELVKSGTLGPIREVHCWADSPWDGKDRPTGEPVPPTMNYDLWLGPVEYRPYSHEYLPFNWRRWWAFGGGTLADFCCHLTDLAFWACDLTSPLSVEAEGPPVHPDCVPSWLIVRYEYAARGNAPPLKLIWYSGGKRPPIPLPTWGNGVLFVGDKGMLLTNYSQHVLLPEKDFVDFAPPKTFIPDSPGHYAEWINACKTNGATTCNFEYGALLTEAGLLGNVAYRTGKKIEWDPLNMRAKNCPEAEHYIQHQYRDGWRI